MQLNMSEQELRNLQIYISKRNQGQTDEQVINHITKINSKTPLTQEEWHKLIFPSCNNGYVEILRAICKGDIKKKIAKNLFISERTLYNHIQNIYDKLEVSNTVEAYNKAIKLGYIEPLM